MNSIQASRVVQINYVFLRLNVFDYLIKLISYVQSNFNRKQFKTKPK